MHLNGVNIIVANSFFKRFFGLMGKKNISYGMFFPNCNAIHTFFMKQDILVVVLDNNYKILDIKKLKPWKIYTSKYKKTNILEFPINISFKYKIGDLISL